MPKDQIILVGNWATGSANTDQGPVAVLEFHFSDRPKMGFAIPLGEVPEIIKGLQDAVKNVGKKPN